MQQYFLNKQLHIGERVGMEKEQAHHITHVLRMKAKDEIRLADYEGHLYAATIEFGGSDVFAIVEKELEDKSKTCVEITLAQCLIKKEKWDFLLQKSAELGVCCIQPFVSSRCVVKEKDEKQEKKKLRWNKILQEACEQCKRSTLVDLKDTCSLKELKELHADLKLLAYEDADCESDRLSAILQAHKDIKSVLIVVGCEGGFSLSEVESLEAVGFQRISLGGRILRAETAAMSLINSISFFYEMGV